MLKNELKYIEELLLPTDTLNANTVFKIDIDGQFNLIREAWEKAIFSDSSEHSLVRYFHFHLDGVSKLSDKLHVSNRGSYPEDIEDALLTLIDHLRDSYSAYFNLDARVPVIFHKRLMAQLQSSISVVDKSLQVSKLSFALKTCLLNLLSELTELSDNVRYSFRSVSYLEHIIYQLLSIDLQSDMAEELLVTILLNSNFNHLSFFVYRQNSIRDALVIFSSAQEKLEYLQMEKSKVLSSPELKNIGYDSSWPSLKTMLSTWLQEEVCLAEQALRKDIEIAAENNVPKLPIQTSVAHMACIIRLLFEENVFSTNNLKLIFKCFAGHYQTKRQSSISPGSLSKEFYSIDQHTAARVRDLLQRMVLRLNRNFFPVWLVTGAIILRYPNMC